MSLVYKDSFFWFNKFETDTVFFQILWKTTIFMNWDTYNLILLKIVIKRTINSLYCTVCLNQPPTSPDLRFILYKKMPIVGLYNRKTSIVHAKETFHSHASSYRNVTTDAEKSWQWSLLCTGRVGFAYVDIRATNAYT